MASFAVSVADVVAGACGTLTITHQLDGVAAAPGQPLQVNVSITGDVTFFGEGTCSQNLGSSPVARTLPGDSNSLTVHFIATTAGSRMVSAGAGGVAAGTGTFTVNAGAAASVRFVPREVHAAAGQCSAVSVQLRDVHGNGVRANPGVTVSGSSLVRVGRNGVCSATSVGVDFSSDAEQVVFVTVENMDLVIVMGQSLSVSMAGSTDSIPAVGQPARRHGTCESAPGVGQTVTLCPISPPLANVDGAILVAETTILAAPLAGNLNACTLQDAATLRCERGRTSGDGAIRWQIQQMTGGIRVRHVRVPCGGPVAVMPAVNPASTFTLQHGTLLDGVTDEAVLFTQATLSAAGDSLTPTRTSGCVMAVQLITWPGARVVRLSDTLAAGQHEKVLVMNNQQGQLPGTVFLHPLPASASPVCSVALEAVADAPSGTQANVYIRRAMEAGCTTQAVPFRGEFVELPSTGGNGFYGQTLAYLEDGSTGSTIMPVIGLKTVMPVGTTRTLGTSLSRAVGTTSTALTDVACGTSFDGDQTRAVRQGVNGDVFCPLAGFAFPF